MEIIGLGAALGILIAAACVMCYRKGLRDGVNSQAEGSLPPVAYRRHPPSSEGGKHEDEAAMMMRRYEAILSYDPYNQRAGMSGGERV